MNNLNMIKDLVKKDNNQQSKISYSIGRNEKCPCGSGKKFKKCCALNNPQLSREDYFQKIKEIKEEEKLIALLKEAAENYPLEQSFILPLIVYSLQHSNYQRAIKYLKHAWQLMGTDLDEAFISPLINIMVAKGELEKAEAIIRDSLAAKGESIPLLIAQAEVYKADEKMQRVNEIIDRAMQLDADNLQLIVFRLETLMDFDDVVSSLALYEKYYEQLKDYKQMRVIGFLDDFIEKRFNLKENQELGEKEALKAAQKIFAVFEEVDNLNLKTSESRAKELLEKIKDLPPKNSQIVLDILAYYLTAELYDEFEDYAQVVNKVQKDNPNYLRLLFLKFYNQGELKKAYQYISQAFELEKARKDGHFHNWQVAADYLQFIVDYGSSKDLKNFIADFAALIAEDKDLLSHLMLLLENNNSKQYKDKLLNKILAVLEESEIKNIEQKDVYNKLFFTKLLELDIRERVNKKAAKNKLKEIEELSRTVTEEEVNTPVLSYAKLRLLKYQAGDLKEEQEKLIAAVKNSKVESYYDAIAYYETMLRFADPAPILTEIPYSKYLDDQQLEFYRLTAALNLSYYEIASEIFYKQFLDKIQQNELASFFISLLRYFDKEEILEHLDKLKLNEEIVNYFIEMMNIKNN
ncbi:MAG: zinc chelation protein SecC [Halanaerobium sp. MSAO_Bac5]|nr:MAG: zinc chelation protein SecC [Halanaerobium sp. MSAO_Bac5]